MSRTDDRIFNELLPVDRHWMDDALCPQTDPDAFFPEKGGTSTPAKRICGRCSVSASCLAYALENGIREGIWGDCPPESAGPTRRTTVSTSPNRCGCPTVSWCPFRRPEPMSGWPDEHRTHPPRRR